MFQIHVSLDHQDPHLFVQNQKQFHKKPRENLD